LARKILLADDSVTAQNMGRRILSDAGYDVTTVNNGSAALKKIAESKPDLIVLDVYMPGYGGLEVCQRLREAPETARIPVLLTVGKLEPFKAEEAKRVRADAFIVKPFEASELLTALTKLEDKIVPQSQPAKTGRFARALAGADEMASGKEFGDSETGWKNRLSIPPPYAKPRESAPEGTPTAAASSRDSARIEEPKPAEMKSGLEEALMSSLPQDVTPEEIAAIKAAAAAFSTPGNESTLMNRRSTDRAPAPIEVPVARAEEPTKPIVEISAAAETAASTTAEQSASPETVNAGEVPTEAVPPPAPIAAEADARAASQVVNAETGKLVDDEVSAALASLAPANGKGHAAAMDRDADHGDLASREYAPVTMAVAGTAQEFTGPRWIAEPVPLRDDEATLILEQEMEKAYAAFAAADANRMIFASSLELPSTSLLVAEAPAAIAEAPSSTVEAIPNSVGSAPEPQESAAYPPATGNEGPAASESQPSAVAASRVADAVSERATSEVNESAAYAAAASASASPSSATAEAEAISQMSPVAEPAQSAPAGREPGEPQGESELAAAWANWKQVRESVVDSQLSSQIADTVAELSQNHIEAQPESQPDAPPATGEETSEIANIVDSVLADLKPKLMAEIARKMGKEKKK
jgi:CheY-like chemotaxis protein